MPLWLTFAWNAPIDSDNRREIGGGSASEDSEAECADLVFDSVLYIEPMELCQ